MILPNPTVERSLFSVRYFRGYCRRFFYALKSGVPSLMG